MGLEVPATGGAIDGLVVPAPSDVAWPFIPFAGAIAGDPNNILASRTDHGDGSFSIEVDDSTASADADQGYRLVWPALDPHGRQAVQPYKFTLALLKAITFPDLTSNLVAMVGFSDTADMSGVWSGLGIKCAGGNRTLQRHDGTTATDLGSNADLQAAEHAYHWRGTSSKVSGPYSGRNVGYNSSNARVVEGSLGSVASSWSSGLYVFCSVWRTATGGGNASIRVRPSFISSPNVPEHQP